MLVANFNAGLNIIEVSDPLNPVLFGNISTGGSAIGVCMIEIGVKIYALVPIAYAGLEIIEVSDP